MGEAREIQKPEDEVKLEELEFDKNTFSEEFQQKLRQIYGNLARLIKSDLALQQKNKTLFQTYKKEDVIKWMNQPSKYEKQLINLSKYLYGVSTHYRRLIGYFADMGVDSAWGMSFYGKDYLTKTNTALKKTYDLSLYLIDKMNIPHEYNKIKKTLWTEGIYYGYEYEGDDSYFIKKLDHNYCRINGVEDGAYTFEFDFTYFDSHPYELESSAKEFKVKYKKYQEGKKEQKNDISGRWQTLNTESSICLKLDENMDFIFPPFMGLFLDIYDIQDYKELKKAKEELDNYKLLVAKIPMYTKDAEPEQYLLDMDTAIKYGRQFVNIVPEGIGFGISPYESIEAIKLSETTQREKNAVSDSEKALWDAAGVNQNIFSGEATTEGTLNYSIKADESTVFAINRQFERWVNRKIKLTALIKEKIAFYFLDVTIYNRHERLADEILAMKLGVPNKLNVASILGISPSRVQQTAFIENEILDLVNTWEVPLNTNVLSGRDGQQGRPTKEEGEPNEE